MRGLDAGDRLKYCRKILKISQKELADNKVSSNLISLIERGRVPLSTVTASLLIDNLNKISKERQMDMKLSLKDLLIPYGEYVIKLCEGSMHQDNNTRYIESMYDRFLGISYDINDVLVNINIELFFGKIMFSKGKIKDAENHLAKSLGYFKESDLEVSEDIVDLYYYLSQCYYKNGNIEEGVKLGEECYKMIVEGSFEKNYVGKLKELIWESLSEYENQITKKLSMDLKELGLGRPDKVESIKKMIDILYEYADCGQCYKIKNILEELKSKAI